MATYKIFGFPKISGRFAFALRKANFSIFHPKSTKALKFYCGFTPSIQNSNVLTPNEPHRAVRTESQIKSRLSLFKTRLSSCVDSKLQYELLMELQETDIDMYYHFLQQYTRLALYIFCKNDCVTNCFSHLDAILYDKYIHKINGVKRMDFSNAIAHLQKQVDAQRQEKSTSNSNLDLKSESRTTENSTHGSIQKEVLKTPKISFMIYVKSPKK